MDTLPTIVLVRIVSYLSVPEQVRLGTRVFPEAFAERGPVNVVLSPLEPLQGIPDLGWFEWDPQQDCLTLRLVRDNRRRPDHAWVDAQIPLLLPTGINNNTPGVFFRFQMEQLRPNGGYCSLVLRRSKGEEATGHLEIKFDHALLRGYGSAVTEEDFGVPTSIEARQWIHLHVQFLWSKRQVRLSVDGVLVKTVQLNEEGWDGVHAIFLRGYKHYPWEQHSQAWSHIYVERTIQ
ncbi:expressed unknown protein [Seminavis robusta]|uniref:Uncharacterized protein n=1 Tax=Seminavis robusta TaxID=568900 RepID=A0A9N8E4L5_9STRA|nr:expressed unknown protein [Seminavis robusta]|eukprot:Sro652_g181830.1 n/a (234) ;mRNA; r:33348-34049